MRSTHAIGAALAALLIAAPFFVFAAPDIVFFYSPTCPHCTLEEAFLKELEKRDDALVIARYSVDEPATIPLLKDLLREHDAERYFGVVPLTFVGESFFVGFDSAKGIGVQIEAALQTRHYSNLIHSLCGPCSKGSVAPHPSNSFGIS